MSAFPLIAKYLVPLLEQRAASPNWRESPLASCLFDETDEWRQQLEDQLLRASNCDDFELLFEVKLRTDPDPDERIYDVLAEVRAAEVLSGYFDRVQVRRPPKVAEAPKSCDFFARREAFSIPVEVKEIGAEDFKGWKPTAPGLGFGSEDLSADGKRTNRKVMRDTLYARVLAAVDQLRVERSSDDSLSAGMAFVVTRRDEH